MTLQKASKHLALSQSVAKIIFCSSVLDEQSLLLMTTPCISHPPQLCKALASFLIPETPKMTSSDYLTSKCLSYSTKSPDSAWSSCYHSYLFLQPRDPLQQNTKGYFNFYSTNTHCVLYSLQHHFNAILFDPLILVKVSRMGIPTIAPCR